MPVEKICPNCGTKIYCVGELVFCPHCNASWPRPGEGLESWQTRKKARAKRKE